MTDDVNNTILKITPWGVVSTFATGFNNPSDLAFDAAGNLFVANLNNGIISKVTPLGVVSTFVHIPYNNPTGNGDLIGLAFDKNGNLFTSNFKGRQIHKVTPS